MQPIASSFAGSTTANHGALSRSDRCQELTDQLRIDFADRWSSNGRKERRKAETPREGALSPLSLFFHGPMAMLGSREFQFSAQHLVSQQHL